MFTPTQLTQRQSEIVHLAMNGKSNKEIAKALGISDYTVRDLLSHVMRKLNVTRRGELRSYGHADAAVHTISHERAVGYPLHSLRDLTRQDLRSVSGGCSTTTIEETEAPCLDRAMPHNQNTNIFPRTFAYHINRLLGILHM